MLAQLEGFPLNLTFDSMHALGCFQDSHLYFSLPNIAYTVQQFFSILFHRLAPLMICLP